MAEKQTTETYRAYLFTGETDSRRQSTVDEIISQSASDAFDIDKLDGMSTTAEHIITSLSVVPMMSEKKVLAVDRIDKLNPDDQVRIAEFIPKLGSHACLIMLADGGESGGSRADAQDDEKADGKKRRKKGLQPELTKSVKQHGKLVKFSKLRANDFGVLVKKAFVDRKKQIEGPALMMIARALSDNPSLLDAEADKLVAYIGEREKITVRDVDAVCIKSAEDKVFAVIDALSVGRPDQAIELLDETFAASSKPDAEVPKILALIGRHIRLLYQMKFLKSQGIRNFHSIPEDIERMLMNEKRQTPAGLSDWQRGKLIKQADAFSFEHLQKSLKFLLNCELTVKGISNKAGSPRLNLEMLVFRLSSRKQQRKGERSGASSSSRIYS